MLVRRLIALLAVCALPLAGCGGSSKTSTAKLGSTDAIKGTWSGRLTQTGRPPFQVAAVINPDGGAAVAYTGIDCGGLWDLNSGPGSSRTYVFKETIVGGQGNGCKSSGTVTIAQTAAGTLSYHFTGGGVQSTGTLARASAQTVQNLFHQAGLSALR
jgi:hypothetical protein